jgi:hypothetical protein
MTDLPPRVRAVAETHLAFAREYSGLHEYDGQLQDLSPAGVRASLRRLGGEPLGDALDEATVAAAEEAARTRLGTLEFHRSDPLLHIEAMDLASYDRDYADEAARADARRRHLELWPDAVDAAIESLDRVPQPVAAVTARMAGGLALAVQPADGVRGERALAALHRLVAHLTRLAEPGTGESTGVLGAERLARLLGCGDGIEVDLGRLTGRAAAEKQRITAILEEACGKLAPGEPLRTAVPGLLRRHGTFDEVVSGAQRVVTEAKRFITEHDLVPFPEGDCIVAATPPARRWAMARISWSAPWERAAPAWFHLTPPDSGWNPQAQDAWLARFGDTTLPVMTVHETFPGHASNAIAMRHVTSLTRRTLWSELFFEGWAHYCEELCLEEGFRAGDPLFQAGVAVEALVRLTRLENAVAIHTGAFGVDEGTHLFTTQAFIDGPAAQAEARRGLFEPTYVRYAFGKTLVRDLREQARRSWGPAFSVQRFNGELLALGSPPLGAVAGTLGFTDERTPAR